MRDTMSRIPPLREGKKTRAKSHRSVPPLSGVFVGFRRSVLLLIFSPFQEDADEKQTKKHRRSEEGPAPVAPALAPPPAPAPPANLPGLQPTFPRLGLWADLSPSFFGKMARIFSARYPYNNNPMDPNLLTHYVANVEHLKKTVRMDNSFNPSFEEVTDVFLRHFLNIRTRADATEHLKKITNDFFAIPQPAHSDFLALHAVLGNKLAEIDANNDFKQHDIAQLVASGLPVKSFLALHTAKKFREEMLFLMNAIEEQTIQLLTACPAFKTLLPTQIASLRTLEVNDDALGGLQPCSTTGCTGKGIRHDEYNACSRLYGPEQVCLGCWLKDALANNSLTHLVDSQRVCEALSQYMEFFPSDEVEPLLTEDMAQIMDPAIKAFFCTDK